MTVPVGGIRATGTGPPEDAPPGLPVVVLFWVSTAVLAAVLLTADPVFGPFVVGIPLLLVVLAREHGLDAVPPTLFGAVIGSSVVFGTFLGHYRSLFHDGLLIAGYAVLVVWAGAYPAMLARLDRQHHLERPAVAGDPAADRPRSVTRLRVVRAWMPLLAVAVVVAAVTRDLAGV